MIQEQTQSLYLTSPSGELFTNPLFLFATCFLGTPSPVAPELPAVGGRSVEVWISPDPLRQYHSPYDYCGGDPINCIDRDGRAGTRALWTLNRIEKTVHWEKLGVNIFKDSRANSLGEKLWWSKDVTGHGGSTWKVYRETKGGWDWVADADEYGQFILTKHKGQTGRFIPKGETTPRANPSGTVGGLGTMAGIVGFIGSFFSGAWALNVMALGEGAEQMAGPAAEHFDAPPSIDPNCIDLP